MAWQVVTCVLLVASVYASCNDCTTDEDGSTLLQTNANVAMEKFSQEEVKADENKLEKEVEAEEDEDEGERLEDEDEDEEQLLEKEVEAEEDEDEGERFEEEDEDEEQLSKWQKYLLKQHNIVRCMHKIRKLRWSNSLARGAQKWAKRGRFAHSSGSYGENLAMGSGYKGSVKAWYKEIKHTYKGKGRVSRFSMSTGHYTQLVWKSTKYVGCGKKGTYIVCRYKKAGNMAGAFKRNVFSKKRSYSKCKRKVR